LQIHFDSTIYLYQDDNGSGKLTDNSVIYSFIAYLGNLCLAHQSKEMKKHRGILLILGVAIALITLFSTGLFGIE
jgi:hypothetical protein